ncbi:hypothetical protein A3K29_05110 [Candidatus Collierbacteria bacterium RIFOXYB2_FULL_46_14]|uniref:Uncharacterized protein n=1 Tax=Candidatus Collierbacteria bacterium GW2011_GWA2_46_26 TaxID=1618381 RepID=A0A0G1PK09_9BACT|nr:MAG: hypothetical protein UX47_C0006G0013 [Candidatus Collierbacteria bacterium GW2011_GWA2_46_26]OGD73474.1 MAG: hypothetical protein A3K29_05110 [Candidatus Collierbacteria bacterium RIFOXYB2_FULL_46_14]OGD76516.1 MAG: hypothetical protein A3K43_05110 [Candidatus Collierbacteria bacterium RIFOXYA2_FULL_46_20]OGD77852.1 MAG: hypothetical protein A3K39_05110 [Candidatus Collierbacteria bacterium RIFOXYC2_FULL_43_15]OGD81143.1 MAG: hypothetical protein A2320_05610 [Pseudomonadales bacterium G
MLIFARGFSERLNIIATANRPPVTTLSFAEITELCKLAGYRLSKVNETMFTIFHHDGKHGLDNGLYIIWHVLPDHRGLAYYPTLQPLYSRGKNHQLLDEMLKHLASFLPNIGFKSEIVFSLQEEIVVLPEELKARNSGIEVMLLSEFQAKYKPLYRFLQEKMVTPR